MMRRITLGWGMKMGLILTLILGLVGVGLAAQEPEDKPISLQLEEATIQKAIEMLAKKVGFEYMITWPQGQVPPVISLTVIDCSWKEALDLIVKEAKMVYEVEDGVYKIRPRPTPIASTTTTATAPPSPPPPPTPPPPKATRVQKRDKTQEKQQEAEVPLGKPKPQLIPVKHLSAPIVAYLLGGQALYEWMFNPMGMGGGYGGYGGYGGGYGSSYGGYGSSYGSSGWGGSSYGSSGWGGSSFGSSGWGGSSFGSGRSGSSWGGGGSFGRR